MVSNQSDKRPAFPPYWPIILRTVISRMPERRDDDDALVVAGTATDGGSDGAQGIDCQGELSGTKLGPSSNLVVLDEREEGGDLFLSERVFCLIVFRCLITVLLELAVVAVNATADVTEMPAAASEVSLC